MSAKTLHQQKRERPKLRRRWLDDLTSLALWSIALGTVAILLWIVGEMAYKGASAVLSLSYWTGVPSNAGRAGGILSLLVSTLCVLGLSLLVCVPHSLSSTTQRLQRTWRRVSGHCRCMCSASSQTT